MLTALRGLLCSKQCWHNVLVPIPHNFFYLGTEVPRRSAGSSDGGTYIRTRKRANYLNSAHHKRPGCSSEATGLLEQNSNNLWLQREGNAVYFMPVA